MGRWCGGVRYDVSWGKRGIQDLGWIKSLFFLFLRRLLCWVLFLSFSLATPTHPPAYDHKCPLSSNLFVFKFCPSQRRFLQRPKTLAKFFFFFPSVISLIDLLVELHPFLLPPFPPGDVITDPLKFGSAQDTGDPLPEPTMAPRRPIGFEYTTRN